MYMQDYDETYPMGIQNDWWGSWARTLQPYVKNMGVYRCPSDSVQPEPDYSPWAGPRLSYSSNGYMAWGGSAWGVAGISGMGQNWMAPFVRSVAAVNRPADTVLLAEKHHPTNTFDWGCGPIITGVNWWDSYSPGLIPDGTRNPAAAYPEGPDGAVTPRHSGVANFAFADGHVKALRPVQTNPDPTNRPLENMWDGNRQ